MSIVFIGAFTEEVDFPLQDLNLAVLATEIYQHMQEGGSIIHTGEEVVLCPDTVFAYSHSLSGASRALCMYSCMYT